MDDPFSLLAFAVWTLATGMYPLGFMFGVCSACCDDECPDECSKCAGIFHLPPNGRKCHDTFDLFTLRSDIDVATKANVTADSNNAVNISIDLLTGLSCQNDGGSIGPITITLQARFLEVESVVGECDCFVCSYTQGFFMRVAGYGTPTSASCLFYARFSYDKCDATSETATLTLTQQQIADCLSEGFFVGSCAGLPDEVEVTLTYDLDYECECGACCRGATCTENESEDYCEVNDFPLPGGGTWQGVGTDCDPNPCE